MTRMSATIRGTRDKIVTALVLGEYRTAWLGKLTSTITTSVDAAQRSAFKVLLRLSLGDSEVHFDEAAECRIVASG